jgi:lipopolysaccharide export LptBFGC system permease protein LptF
MLLVEWHKRIALPVSGFFIGPLAVGLVMSRIRRWSGGPIAAAVVLALVFYVALAFGERAARNAVLSPMVGVWAPTALLPLAFAATRQRREAEPA